MKSINLSSNIGLAGLYFVFNTSFLNEKAGEYGINHFLEHLLCSRIKENENKLTINGIYWNAATYLNCVVFYFRGLSEIIKKHYDFLAYLVINAEIKKEDIENEKKIVLEEYKDGFINKFNAGYLNSFRKIFGVYMQIGQDKSIAAFNYDKSIVYKEKNFKKPLIIYISDKHTKNDCKSDCDALYLDWIETLRPPKYLEKSVAIDNSSSKDKYAVSFVFEESNQNALLELTCSLLSTGLNSPLYDEIREKDGLSYYVYCTAQTLGNKNYFRIDCCTSKEQNIKKIEDRILSIINDPNKYITKKRFDEIISYELIDKKKNAFYKHKDMNMILLPEKHLISSVLNTDYESYMDFYKNDFMKLKNKLLVV